MRPTNKKNERKVLLSKFGPEKFESYEDFFYYLHLNNDVRYMHLIGMFGGLLFLPLAIYLMKVWAFVLYFLLFYGFGFLSLWIFDGIVSRTAKEAPWKSFVYATKINLICLRPSYVKRLDAEFFLKYPFVDEVFPKQ